MAARSDERLIAAWVPEPFAAAVDSLVEAAGLSKSDLVRASVSRALLDLAETQPVRRGSPAYRAKISASLKGRAKSPEAIEKAAATRRGRPLSHAHRQAISRAKKGRKIQPHSEEHKARLRAAALRNRDSK